MTPSTGEGVERGQPQTAIVATSGAREELCSAREKGRAWLGLVEEGMGVLTAKPIESWWPDAGDRRAAGASGGAAALVGRDSADSHRERWQRGSGTTGRGSERERRR